MKKHQKGYIVATLLLLGAWSNANAQERLWLESDWEDKNLGIFNGDAEWNINKTAGSIRVVDERARSGQKSLKFSLEGKRTEIAQERGNLTGLYETDLWYGYSIFIDVVNDSSNRAYVTQWHAQPDGCDAWREPVLAWQINGDGRTYKFESTYSAQKCNPSHGPGKNSGITNVNHTSFQVPQKEWLDFVYHVVYDYDSPDGRIQGWWKRAGESEYRKVLDYSGRVGYNDLKLPYLKFGAHWFLDGEVFVDNVRMFQGGGNTAGSRGWQRVNPDRENGIEPPMPPMPDPDVTRVEAESLERQGFELESGTDYAASADALVKLTSADAPGTVEYIFDLTDGTYQIAVGYADEGDGVGTWSLAKNNIVLGTWTGEFNSGSGGFANFQAAEAVFEDVVLRSGDSLTIGAQANDGEFGRTDYLDFTLIEEAPGPDPDLPSVPLEPGAIDFASVQPASYFGNQDQGAVSISETGATLALQNNAWKSVAFDYEITTNTVLRVTLQSEDTGELLGVGFDDNIDPTDRRTLFHLGGSQSPGDSFWDVSPKYTAGEGSVEYTIMPGDFFTGAMTSLVFVVDDDADASGKATFSNVTVFEEIPEPQQQPFGGTLADLPGRIEAEAYDEGGPGIAYNDSGAGNIGGGDRQSEDVDTQAADDAGGGENVGWIVTGEWLEYTVDAEAGTYDIMLRVASPRADAGNVALSLDGTALGAVDVPTTGAWQSWRTISLNDVSIGEGEQVLRLSFSGPPVSNGMFNLNWIKFKK